MLMLRPDFDALRELHEFANDRLHIHSPIIQQALAHHHHQKLVHEISEVSMRMLDVCGTIKDVLLLGKHHLQDLQSTLRRISVGEAGLESKLAAYDQYRKEAKKEMDKCLRSFKGMLKKKTIHITKSEEVSVVDHNLVVMVNVLGEVRTMTISIVDSLLSLMAVPRPKPGINFRMKITRNQSGYEKCNVKMLEAVEMGIAEVELEMECIFKRLIQTRVSLLNILSPST